MIAIVLAVVLTCPCPPVHRATHRVTHAVPARRDTVWVEHRLAPMPCYQPCPPAPIPPQTVILQSSGGGWIERHWWIFPLAGMATYAIVEHQERYGSGSAVTVLNMITEVESERRGRHHRRHGCP